ncbi:MAG: hypothetical protein ACM33B_12665 [Pseudomonadota bacterium]
MTASTVPTVDDVQRIAAVPSPVLRNLLITRCYSQLAAALAERDGDGANWCTYATWASRQAGSTIRGEDLVERLARRLDRRRRLLHPWRLLLRRGLFQPETRLGRLTARLHTPFDAFERASDAVARGNLKVFAEIGLAFARYLEAGSADAPAFARFRESLRSGDPPEGQRYLRQAFARYERRRRERDPKLRAELALLANLEIGFHEQTRLQPEIAEALDAAYATNEQLGLRTLEALFPSAPRWWGVVRRPAAGLADVLATRLQRAATRVAREVITESFMTLSLPGRVLALGRHLDVPFPDDLREPELADLTALLGRVEPAPPAPDDCAARDWADLDQRMHYIAHLFRAFQLRRELFDSPFTAEQVARLDRGEIPDGAL